MNCRKKIISHAVAATFCLLIGQSEIASAAGTNITAAGAGSWTCPAGVTSVQVEAWGGGGGGGGAQKIGVNSYGGGGGGGAYARLNNFSVTPGSNYVFSVGAAGTAGASSGGNGGAGGQSYFLNPSTLAASGGVGGIGMTNGYGSGGSGGAAGITGDAQFSGGNGATPSSTTFAGQGGGSGGNASNGNNGTNNAGGIVAAVPGGGPGGAPNAVSAQTGPGQAPTSAPGGGGGGARSANASANVGGAGASGQIAITYTNYVVSSVSALQTAINNAQAGDVIILANGSYSGSTITINCVGTSNAPILIQAQTIGGVNLTAGGFQFNSPAAWVTVQGFNITGAAGVNVINWLTSHCRFSHNYFQCTGNSEYVRLAGDDAQFDYNELRNKTTTGQMIRIDGNVTNSATVNNPIAQRVWIHHNYFHDFNGTGANGGETIRYGLGVYSASSGYGLVEYNLFDKCNGDSAEMISSKVANNTYRFNTILNTLNNSFKLRESTNSLVYGNYFSNSLGLVVWSYYHKVYNNYFVNCSGGIQIGPGDTNALDYGNATHVEPRYNVLAYNTFVNNTYNIYQSGGDIYGAQSNTIANNLIVGGAKACDWFSQSSPSAFFTNGVFTNNILYNTTAGDMPASGYISSAVNPLLNVTDAYGVPHLAAGSPAIGAAAPGYTNVLVDFDGQPRPFTGADVGADQYSTVPITVHRLTTNDVGPLYANAAAPTFNPLAGTYASATNVTIGTTTVGASIRYTTDGSTPSETNGTIYSGVPVAVSSNLTLKAIAYSSGIADSTVTSAAYTIGQTQIAATVTLGNLSQTYDGTAKNATYTTSPPNLTVILTYNGSSFAPTNAGSYTVIGTISDPVYFGSATNTLLINKATATATLAVGNSPQIYTGAGQSATVSITASNTAGTVANILTGGAATQVSSGSYVVTANFVPANTNYTTLTGLSAGNFVINKATATVTLTNLSQTYDGTAKSVTATTVPPGLTVNVTYNGSPSAPTNAGSYTVIGTVNDINYSGSATNTLLVVSTTPPQFTNTVYSAGSGFTLSGTGPAGQPYRILAATNLTLAITNWTGISTGSFAVGIFSFTDLQTSNQPQRFYRVISP